MFIKVDKMPGASLLSSSLGRGVIQLFPLWKKNTAKNDSLFEMISLLCLKVYLSIITTNASHCGL